MRAISNGHDVEGTNLYRRLGEIWTQHSGRVRLIVTRGAEVYADKAR